MQVVIIDNEEAPIRVRWQIGEIQFSVEKARELRDGLTSALENLKRKGKKEAS